MSICKFIGKYFVGPKIQYFRYFKDGFMLEKKLEMFHVSDAPQKNIRGVDAS